MQVERRQRGFTFIEIVVVVAMILVLGAIAFTFFMGVYSTRVLNTVAMTDVANVAKAMEAISDSAQFEMTVTGPGPVPSVPGARVSKGTTLFLRRLLQGRDYDVYIRGTYQGGSVTYYFQNGTLYADSEAL
ncbi:MAG: type II secretion system protein [Deltaproteobacteria bacterium]|nr:type II secretion system protein [Deltaproteobacteria bacterium]